MLTVANYESRSGFELDNGVIVIEHIVVSVTNTETLHRDLKEDGNYRVASSPNTNIHCSANVFKDLQAHDDGNEPVEAVRFDNPHYSEEHIGMSKDLAYLDFSVPDVLTKEEAIALAYDEIKKNRSDITYK